MKSFIAKLLVSIIYALIFAAVSWIITQFIQMPTIFKYSFIGAFGPLGFSIGYFYFKKALNGLGEIAVESFFRLIFKGLKLMINGVFDSV